MRLLVISYYWHPDEGTGVYRIGKLVKYLQKEGWQITVLTATQGTEKSEDATPRVVRVRGFKLSSLWFSQKSPSGEAAFNPSVFYQPQKSLKQRLLIWARLNLLVPDAKLGWYRAALKTALQLHREMPFDRLLSTSPPPTVNLIARSFQRRTGVPWTADFRDPWTQIYYYESFPQGWLAGRINRWLEARCVKAAQKVVCVSNNFFPFALPRKVLRLLPNGYDPDDFAAGLAAKPREDRFVIRYLGTLKMNQFAPGLLEALSRLGDNFPALIRFEGIGRIDPQYAEALRSCSAHIEWSFPGLLPHQEAVQKMRSAHLLLLIIGKAERSKNIFSTKLFEYLNSGRPVLGIGHPEGAASQLIRRSEAGLAATHTDSNSIYTFLALCLRKWQAGEPLPQAQTDAIEKYNFVHLSAEMDQILKDAGQ